ncbi:MAG: hypothetical protein Q9190_006892, partial [Brigantiaea leucoxantha]
IKLDRAIGFQLAQGPRRELPSDYREAEERRREALVEGTVLKKFQREVYMRGGGGGGGGRLKIEEEGTWV